MKLNTQVGGITTDEGISLKYTAHFPAGVTPNIETDDGNIFGCDYSTVYATDDASKVDEVVSRLTEDDFEAIDELGFNCAVVYDFNGVYIVMLDNEYVNKHLADYLTSNLIGFGAVADDAAIMDCLLGCQEQQKNSKSFDDLKELYQDGEFEEDEFLDISVDFFIRVQDYSDDSVSDELIRVLDLISQKVDGREWFED